MAKSLGSPFWLLVVWLAVGAMSLSGALCFGELAGRFPSAGGAYVYLRESFGPRLAFLYGWMSLLVLDPGLTAAFATGLAAYAAYIFHWSPLAIKFAAIAAIWIVCLLNILSTRISAGFLRWITWLKFAVLITLTVWALAFRLGSWENFVPFVAARSGALPLVPALGAATIGAFFCFSGWWDATKISGEVRDPGRNLASRPRFRRHRRHHRLRRHQRRLHLPGPHRKSRLQRHLRRASRRSPFRPRRRNCFRRHRGRLRGRQPRGVHDFCPARLLRDGCRRALPQIRRANPSALWHACARRAVQGIVAAILVALGSFEQIIAYFFFVVVLFLGITVAGLFVIRHRPAQSASAILTPGYPVTPVAFLVLVAVMLVLLAVRSPREAVLGCVVVAAGSPVYSWIRKR